MFSNPNHVYIKGNEVQLFHLQNLYAVRQDCSNVSIDLKKYLKSFIIKFIN